MLGLDGSEYHTPVHPRLDSLLTACAESSVARPLHGQRTNRDDHDPPQCGPVRTFSWPGQTSESKGNSPSHAQPLRRPDGRIFRFHRGREHDHKSMHSTDGGQSHDGRPLAGLDGCAPFYISEASAQIASHSPASIGSGSAYHEPSNGQLSISSTMSA